MSSKNLPLYLSLLGFLFIFSGCVSTFIIGLKQDQDKVKARMVDVNSSYEEFSTYVSLYEDERDLLYVEVLGNIYYDTLASKDTSIKDRLGKYEELVNTIDKNRNVLDKLCRDVYYPDSSTNSKCINYKSIYEQVNNYFVTDINYYNNNIDKYNDYSNKSNLGVTLKKYVSKKDYIDYNNDKKFDGKEE